MVIQRSKPALLLLALVALASCSNEQQVGPPDLYIDEDVCHLCGMIISEEKFSAAIVEVTPGGREPFLFDDIGDMIVHMDDLPDATTIEAYVHDFSSREWIVARNAWFTKSESLSTPMATGLAAFSNKTDAEKHLEAFPGEVMDWNALLAR